MLKISSEDLKKLKNEAICHLIILNRNYSNNLDLVSQLMEELSLRRKNGDLFDYEECLKELKKEFDSYNNNYLFHVDQVE